MTEDREAPRLHPDDIAALVIALREGAPRTSPDAPRASDVLTGGDARVLTALIEGRVAHLLDQQPANLLSCQKRSKIGLRMDEDHIEETGNAVRSAMKWHKRIDKVVAGMAISVLAAIGYALLGLIGIKLPAPGAN